MIDLTASGPREIVREYFLADNIETRLDGKTQVSLLFSPDLQSRSLFHQTEVVGSVKGHVSSIFERYGITTGAINSKETTTPQKIGGLLTLLTFTPELANGSDDSISLPSAITLALSDIHQTQSLAIRPNRSPYLGRAQMAKYLAAAVFGG